MPVRRCSILSSVRMRSRSFASRLDSGSSNSRIAGSTTSDRARATRCCWLPESWPGWRRSSPSRPTTASTRATRSPICARKPSKSLSMPAMSMNAIALAPHRGRLARRPVRAGQPADEPSERQNYGDGENGERRDDLELPQIVEAINGNGNGLGAARVEQDGGAELTEGCNEHQQERDEKARARKRKQNAADCEPPGCAGDASRLLQRRIDLAEDGVDAARGQRDEACD